MGSNVLNPVALESLGLSPAKKALLELRLKRAGGGLQRSAYRGSAPLSYSQEMLWVLDQLHPRNLAYSIPRAMRLSGELDVSALQRSLNEVVQRHEVLRTTYAADEGTPVQIVHPPCPFFLEKVDLAGKNEEEVQEHIVEEARKPFDLARDLMFRAKLFQLGRAEHILFLNTHHIASDGVSAGILLKELGSLYEDYGIGKDAELPPLPIQYIDFALWQRSTLVGSNIAADLEFWRKQLANAAPVLELPYDQPRPAVQTFEGSRERRMFSLALLERLLAISRQEQATPFVVMMAAFQAFLFRYSRQPDILIGTPIAGREQPELSSIVGMFANTLVLRTVFAEDLSFRELVGRVRETAFAAYGHQALPFDKLVSEINPQRSLSHSPVFQVMFVHNPESLRPRLGDLKIEEIKIDRGAEKFDLLVSTTQTDEGLAVTFEYSSDLFSRERIIGMLGNFETFLHSAGENPDERVSALNLIPEGERKTLLSVWNNTTVSFPDACVDALISEQARRTPTATAAVFAGRSLTYEELETRSNQMACHLSKVGVVPGSLVALCVDRSLEMLVALLAIWKAGGAYVPLDPNYPADRLALIMKDAAPKLLIAQSHLADVIQAATPHYILDDPANVKERNALPKVSAERAGASDQLAYVIFTSGSTGRPKGVEIQHGAVVNLLTAVAREPGFTSRDNLLAVTTLSFDIAGLELYLPLLMGGTVTIASRDATHDGLQLAALIESSHATVMQATPATWRMLLDSGWHGSPGLKIFCGGEALPRELASRLLQCGSSLWNLYGPTETTIWSAVERVSIGGDPVLLGRPMSNTQFYVLGDRSELLPTGVAGELCIGGAGLARGYFRDETATSTKFIPHPFHSGERLYRTGDLARYHFDGRLEFLGRMDHQVKIRGFRIELGEIETLLEKLPAVKQAVVVARETPDGNKRLVAFVAAEAEVFDAVAIRAALAKELPDYMIPSEFARLESLPLTPNGKVDRKALPILVGVTEPRSYQAPQGAIEETVAEIWSRALAVEKIGTDVNFFEAGGHSLLATRVLSEIRKALGVPVSFRVFFENPTIAGMANLISEELIANADSEDIRVLLDEFGEGTQP